MSANRHKGPGKKLAASSRANFGFFISSPFKPSIYPECTLKGGQNTLNSKDPISVVGQEEPFNGMVEVSKNGGLRYLCPKEPNSSKP